MKDYIKIGKWNVSKKLFDEYVKFLIHANAYLMGTELTANSQERSMRYLLCTQQIMQIHREICLQLGIKYCCDNTDEFYKAFHDKVRKEIELKG